MKNNSSLVYSISLVIGDFVTLLLAFTVAYILRVSINHTPVSHPITATAYFTTIVSLLPFWILMFSLMGLYSVRMQANRFSEFGRLLVGTFVGMMAIISYAYVSNTAVFPARLVTLYGFILAFLFLLLFRTLARAANRELFRFGKGINNVLVVGDSRITLRFVETLGDSSTTGYRVVGVVSAKVGDRHLAYPVFGSFEDAIGALKDRVTIHTIVQTELYSNVEKNNAVLTYAQENHVSYRFVPGNSELFVGNLDVDLFNGIPMIVVHQTALVGWGRVVKRLSDVLFGGIALLLASPLILLIAIIEKVSDPRGQIIYKATRLTRFGNKIGIYKFRTLKQAYTNMSPEEGFAKMGRPELSKPYRDNGDRLPSDPRISRLGHFLRVSSLDELPQLFNVVRGDISLVGPRALDAFELEKYAKKNLILSVKSGLTGLAQISGRSDISFEERRQLDVYYVQNWSFWYDLVILAKTVSVVLFHRGAR